MQYITQPLLALAIAFFAVAVMGPIIIPLLARLKAGQTIREDGPSRHLAKAGTPTMGGIMIIGALSLATFAVFGQATEAVLCLGGTVAFGLIGFWDDYVKVVLKRSLGLKAREKLALQLLFSFLFALYLVFGLSRGTDIVVPFIGTSFQLGNFYIPFLIFVFMSAANAVNLTDGLDGLAGGATFIVSLGFVLIALATSHMALAGFAAALAGSCLGFLLFNRHPARVFMGDTGSMALGGALAAMAAVTKTELVLVILGGIYVIETLSVAIQVISFQTTGKRVFLMSPLHHHFELKGWSEKKVVRVFWLVTLIFVIIGLWGIKGLG
ncbi:MAG: phospho-N-acetylmuramoyl-pentapeptide-transferase [Chitinophagales bacterium]